MKKVLIYVDGDKSTGMASKQVFEHLFSEDKVKVIGGNLKKELYSGEYGLVLDLTTLCKDKKELGAAASILRGSPLEQEIEVQQFYQGCTIVADVANKVNDFYKASEDPCLCKALSEVLGEYTENSVEESLEKVTGEDGRLVWGDDGNAVETGRMSDQHYNFLQDTEVNAMIDFQLPLEKATVYLCSNSMEDTIPEIIDSLLQLQKHYDSFMERGYSPESAKLVHEDESLASKEFQVVVPIKTQESLTKLVRDVYETGLQTMEE